MIELLNEPLAPDAAAVLDVLLDGPGAVLAALREQVPYLRVTERCRCGCATVGLGVDRDAVAAAPGHGSPAAEGFCADSEYGAGVLLFTAGGYLSGLEIYSGADEPLTAWPDPARLTVER